MVVATPNVVTHAPVLAEVFAARSDLPVLVEKPLCTTVDDCRSVMAEADRRPGMVWVGLEYRYMPPVARFLQEVRSVGEYAGERPDILDNAFAVDERRVVALDEI